MNRSGPMPRGGLLLEVMVALAIFVVAGVAILGGLRQSVRHAAAQRDHWKALDLARSGLSMIEAGLATAEEIDGAVPAWRDGERSAAAFDDRPPEPSGWARQVLTEPAGVGGLTLVTIRAYRDRPGGASVTLRQVMATRDAQVAIAGSVR